MLNRILKPHDLLIEARDLTWWYPNSPKLIFNKFNFALYKNDFAVITWKSWSWKTTLAKLIIKQYDTPPKMLFHRNQDMANMTPQEIQEFRRKIWIIFQDYKLLERKTVLENIVYPLSIAWQTLHNKTKKLKDILSIVWLTELQDTIVKYLSWWEKQKTAIARALVHDPEFIIADEPTWNLDPISAQQIADILIQLHSLWKTILLITHNMQLKDYIAKRVKFGISEFTI